MPIPLIVIARVGLFAGVCVATKTRPSTLLRVTEDGVIGTASYIGRKAHAFGHAVSTEFRARQIDALQQAVQLKAEEIRNLDPAARAKLAEDEAAIFARADELRSRREAKQQAKSNRRASRAGRSASA